MARLNSVADATRARTIDDVHKAFWEIEKGDVMVTKVVMGPFAYEAMMKEGDKLVDVDTTGMYLWGAKVKLMNDGALVCWNEEPG